MELLRDVRLRVTRSDVAEVRSLLSSRRLDGITFTDNDAWWRFLPTFTITGPGWAIERATKDIDRIHQDGLIRNW